MKLSYTNSLLLRQHRFVQGLWVNFGHAIADVAGELAPGIVKKAIGQAEQQLLKFFGDALHNF